MADEATDDIFKSNALEGLAVVAEGRRDLETAATRNDAVIALAETMPGFETWSARANARKQLLPQLAEPVSFLEDAAPAETTDATEAATPDPRDGFAEDTSGLMMEDSLELAPISIPTE